MPKNHSHAGLFPAAGIPAAARHGRDRAGRCAGLLCADAGRQPPHPGSPRHPLHRRQWHRAGLRKRRLARVRDDRGRHPRPRPQAGLRHRQRQRELSDRAVPAGRRLDLRGLHRPVGIRLEERLWRHQPAQGQIQIEGATVTAVRCDIQAYYAVLATVEYDSGDVVYVSGLTKLASISDIVNLVESVSLT
mgnify:CR=1 FL=1